MEVDLVRLLTDPWAVRRWPFSLLLALVVRTRRGILETRRRILYCIYSSQQKHGEKNSETSVSHISFSTSAKFY